MTERVYLKGRKSKKKKKEFWVGLTFENECNSP